MRDYGKVHSSFWSSETVRVLSDDGRMLALYLLTSPHTTITGVFRLPDGYAAEDLQWSPERVSKGFSELFANGFANRCGTTKWCWIYHFLEWNRPENPNQCKAAAKIARQIPSSCTWKAEFMRVWGDLLGLEPDPEPNPSETVSKPFRNQEQEQEQEQEQDKTSVPGKPATPPCPHEKIIELYHEHCPALPAVKIWNDQRKALLKARWRESRKHQTLEFWAKYFRYVAQSDFLREGSSDRPWQADLEWLVRPSNFAKVIEGKYHGAKAETT